MEERSLALRLALVLVVECFVDEFKLVLFVDTVVLPRLLGAEELKKIFLEELECFSKDAAPPNAFRRKI